MNRKNRMPAWAAPESIRDLVRLGIPIALSRMSFPAMSVTDSVVLGRMAQLELPYITSSYTLIAVSLAVGLGLLEGVRILTAELAGAGEQDQSGRIFRRGMWVGLAIGVVFTLITLALATPLYRWMGFNETIVEGTASAARILGYGIVFHMITAGCTMYLEALRKPNLVVVISYAGVLINLVLNLAFVAGWWGMPQLGADGVAWATTGTRILLSVVFLVIVFKITPGMKPSSPAPPGEFTRQNTVGMGGALAHVLEYTAFNMTFIMATLHSVATSATYSLGLQPMFMTFMLFTGVGTASSVRVAEAVGRKDPKGVFNASRLSILAVFVVGVPLALMVWIFQDAIAHGMTGGQGDAEVLFWLAPVIAISALALLFDGLQAVAAMVLRAQGVIWIPTVLQLLAFCGVMLPLVWYFTLSRDMGAIGVMAGVALGVFAAGVFQWGLLEWKTARKTFSRAV